MNPSGTMRISPVFEILDSLTAFLTTGVGVPCIVT